MTNLQGLRMKVDVLPLKAQQSRQASRVEPLAVCDAYELATSGRVVVHLQREDALQKSDPCFDTYTLHDHGRLGDLA